MRGIEYLRDKLKIYRRGAQIRQEFYDMKNDGISPGITIPARLRKQYEATLGWGAKAVDSVADRLVFREFANDNFNINEIFQMNSKDILFDDAKLSALINSCSFIYISVDREGFPRLQVIQGSEATGVLDPVTRLLIEGYAVLSRDDQREPLEELYFATGYTDYYVSGEFVMRIPNSARAPLLVPIIHRPDSTKPFGRARITPSTIYYQNFAKRTLERADVTSEFYSWPQKYVTGLDPETDTIEQWNAAISSFLAFDQTEKGTTPQVGQFSVPSMSPFTEQLRTAASGFAGETGLTLDDLGFPSDNPSSAEAIKASHETLRLAAEKAQRDFSSGFLNVGYLAASLRDNFPYKRNQLYGTVAKWEPIFKPDASTISLIGDGALKINQALPGYFTKDNLRDLTGIEGGNSGS